MHSRLNARIGAVILAAGRSSRMGEPKQLLRLGGKFLLALTLENVRAARVSDIVLVLGFAAETIAEQVDTAGARIVVNEDYQQGMGSSLGWGLTALDPRMDAALIVLADQPSVRAETLGKIIDQYRQSNAQIVIPTYRGFRGNPVLLDRSVFHEVMALKDDIGCRAIFGNHAGGILKVSVEDVGILLDIDEKGDLAKFERFGLDGDAQVDPAEAANLHGRDLPEGKPTVGDDDELIIVGAEPVAIALAGLGKLLHFTVTIVDPLLRPSDVANADRVFNNLDFSYPQAASRRYVVVASRGRFDEEATEHAISSNVEYIALVASSKRSDEIRHVLKAKGASSGQLTKLHAPAGLDIGAQTPAEIALSILAEIVLARRKAESG